MIYVPCAHGYETTRMDGTGGIFNGRLIQYDNLAGGSFTVGAVLTNLTSGGTATIHEIVILTATTGKLVLENDTVTWSNNDALQQGGVTADLNMVSLPWWHIYALGGWQDGTKVYTRPAYIDSIVVERPWTGTGSFPNILVLDWPETFLRDGPPLSVSTMMGFTPAGAATKGSYEIPIRWSSRRGTLVRFENTGEQARIAVLWKPLGSSGTRSFVQRF